MLTIVFTEDVEIAGLIYLFFLQEHLPAISQTEETHGFDSTRPPGHIYFTSETRKAEAPSWLCTSISTNLIFGGAQKVEHVLRNKTTKRTYWY